MRHACNVKWMLMVSLLLFFNPNVALSQQIQQTPVAEKKVNYLKVGDTVFVSGRLAHWFGKLLNAVPNTNDAEWMRKYAASPERQIKKIVFVNAIGRPDATTGTDLLNPRFKALNISMTVIGRCDVFCSRIFVAGATRKFGPDLPGQETWVDVRPPWDGDSLRIETRWPKPQVEALTRVLPELLPHELKLVEAIKRTRDEAGGLRIFLNKPAEFCESKNQVCERYPWMTASAIGLTSSSDLDVVEIPAGLDISSPDTPWPPFYNPK